jgi:Uma2 family endonuclease
MACDVAKFLDNWLDHQPEPRGSVLCGEDGVRLVWVIDPHDRTVLIYRPGAAPDFVNIHQDLSGDPELPGFRVPVKLFFV